MAEPVRRIVWESFLIDGFNWGVTERLSEIEKKIYQTRNESSQDILNYPPKLDNQLVGLMSVVESGDARPTDGSVQLYQELVAQLEALRRVLGDELVPLLVAENLGEFGHI